MAATAGDTTSKKQQSQLVSANSYNYCGTQNYAQKDFCFFGSSG
jgi:hypothetical protein